MKSSVSVKKQIIARPFTVGTILLSVWFLWSFDSNEQYGISEWLVYYLIALIAWEPVAAWLREGGRWVPAAELFFLLHLQYYVSPFVNAKEEILELQPELRIKIGLVVAVFLAICRVTYYFLHKVPGRARVRNIEILNRPLDFGPKQYIVWVGLAIWTLFSVALQRGWLPDLGANFNLIRSFFSAVGTLSMFILFYEFGKGQLKRIATYCLLFVTMVSMFWSISTGFLVGATVQAAVSLVAFSIGRKKIPIPTLLILLAVLSFLHAGKMEMRYQYWDEGKNYSTTKRSVLEVYEFWMAASWKRITSNDSDEEKIPTIFDRGSLLQYLARVVDVSPDQLPYLNGNSYIDATAGFIPRFIWPDKPSANAANDSLSIYYGFQTEDGVLKTAVGLGILCEAWGNWGWFGVCLIGAVMGVILFIPNTLSINSSPTQFRFLLSVPFILFSINLEMLLGQSVQSLLQGVIASFLVLVLISKSATNSVKVPETKESEHHSNPNQPQAEIVYLTK